MIGSKKDRLDKISLWCQIFSSCVGAVAAAAVALWAWYSSMHVRQEKEIADYTLTELKQKTNPLPHILADMDINVSPLSGGESLVQIAIKLSNTGGKQGRVTLDDQSLLLVPVAFSEGKPKFGLGISLKNSRYGGTFRRLVLDWIDIGAGESYEVKYAYSIATPGTYLVHFLAFNGSDIPNSPIASEYDKLPSQYSVGTDKYVIIN